MQHQAKHHRHSIEAQLLPHGGRVAHLQDLASHQEDDAEWKVPNMFGEVISTLWFCFVF